MSHTFQVSDAQIPEWFFNRRPETKPWLEHQGVQAKVKGETLVSSDTRTVGGTSPLFHAVGYAFNQHCPLWITPDAVWLTILSGLTHHIDTDPEGLRQQFVSFEGQKELEVKVWAPSIQHVGREIWEAAIQGGKSVAEGEKPFAEQIREHIGKKYDLIVNNFSTTTPNDRLASQITLMGAMKHYFQYKMMLCCEMGLVTVGGYSKDWSDILDRARALSELGLTWWTDHLIPVLDQMRLASEGTPDIDFWKLAYLKHRKGSGGEYDVSGWINVFYPYIAGKKSGEMARNPFVDWQADHGGHYPGVDVDDFPFGLVEVPLKVVDHGTPHDCLLYGGLVGVSMADDFTVQPESGYAVQFLQ